VDGIEQAAFDTDMEQLRQGGRRGLLVARSFPVRIDRIGAHLATNWQLPLGLVDTILRHHDYQPEAQNADLTLIIYLSNIIVNTYDKDPELNIDLSGMHKDAAKFMMSLVEDVSGWYDGLIEEIEGAYAFFLEAD